jgi:uncharacterized membrane protein YccC
VLSGLVVALTIICGGAFTLAVRWESGDLAIGFAAICCSLFATADDPTPMVRDFLAGFIIALPLALFYEFAVLPAIDGFVMLSTVLRRVLLRVGFYRLVWHRHLVDLAFFIILWAATAKIMPFLTGTLGRAW